MDFITTLFVAKKCSPETVEYKGSIVGEQAAKKLALKTLERADTLVTKAVAA